MKVKILKLFIKYAKLMIILIRESFLIKENISVLKNMYKNQGISDATIDEYIERFKEIRDSIDFQKIAKNLYPNIKNPKDITLFKNFRDLEKLVDHFPKKMNRNDAMATNSEAIYNKNGIEIYRATSKNSCIKYGSGYSWCISTKSGGNMFISYRYNDVQRMFYFVFDRNLPTSNPLHAIVIHRYNNGKYGLSDANNKGDKDNLMWKDIIDIKPELDGLQNIFKYVKISNQEQKEYDLIKNSISENNIFDVLKSYDLVEKYIDYGHYLTLEQFKNLPDKLQEKFFSQRSNLAIDFYDIMSDRNKKLYLKRANSFSENFIKKINKPEEIKIITNRIIDIIDDAHSLRMLPSALSGAINELSISSLVNSYLYKFFTLYKLENKYNNIFANYYNLYLKSLVRFYDYEIIINLIKVNEEMKDTGIMLLSGYDLEDFSKEAILKYADFLINRNQIPREEFKFIVIADENKALEYLKSAKDKINSLRPEIKDRILTPIYSLINNKKLVDQALS